jgi:hypothetical protein
MYTYVRGRHARPPPCWEMARTRTKRPGSAGRGGKKRVANNALATYRSSERASRPPPPPPLPLASARHLPSPRFRVDTAMARPSPSPLVLLVERDPRAPSSALTLLRTCPLRRCSLCAQSRRASPIKMYGVSGRLVLEFRVFIAFHAEIGVYTRSRRHLHFPSIGGRALREQSPWYHVFAPYVTCTLGARRCLVVGGPRVRGNYRARGAPSPPRPSACVGSAPREPARPDMIGHAVTHAVAWFMRLSRRSPAFAQSPGSTAS